MLLSKFRLKAPENPSKARVWLLYLFVLLGVILDNVNLAATMATAPSFEEHFHASSSIISWTLSAYALTLCAFIIVFGKLTDILGAHKTFLGGIFVFSFFAMLISAVKSSIIAIIVFRALQGIAGSAVIPAAFSMTMNYFKGDDFPLALSVFSAVMTASFGLGLILGGALGYIDLFWVTFALGMALFIGAWLTILPIEKTEEMKKMSIKNIDYPAVILLIAGLLLIILGLTESANGWDRPVVYVTIPVGVVLLILIPLFENVYLKKYKKRHENEDSYSWRKSVDILFPAEIFKIQNCVPLLISMLLLYTQFMVTFIVFIEYFINIKGDSSIMSAVKVLPLSVGMLVTSVLFSERVAKFLTSKGSLMLSAFILAGSGIWSSRFDYTIENEYWKIFFVPLFFTGVGLVLYYKVYMNMILKTAPPHWHGVITGIFQTSAQIGVSISNAVVAAIIGNVTNVSHDDEKKHALFLKFRNAGYFLVAISCLMIFTNGVTREPRSEVPVESSEESMLDEKNSLSDA